MPKKPLAYALILFSLVTSFFSWHFVDRAISATDASDFWVPLLALSFFAVTLSLLIVLVRERMVLWGAFLVALFLSFIFVHSPWHLVVIALAWTFLFVAQQSIREDIDTSVKINLAKSLQRGIFLVVVSFALMISSQYYFHVKELEGEDIAPDISKGGVTSKIVGLVLPRISPEFKEVKSDEISTDEFLGEIYETIIKREGEEIKSKLEVGANSLQRDQTKKILENELGRELTDDEKRQLESLEISSPLEIPSVSPQIKQEVLREWKKELSKAAGTEIEGDEKVADIFITMINFKIDELAGSKVGKGSSKTLPLIFTMILFLTLISLGSFISRFWTVFSAGIFWILRKTGLVRVDTVTREAEVIRQ